MIVCNMEKKFVNGKLWPRLTGFLLFFLLVYTWTLPFRDIYGMEVRSALMAREMLENGLSIIPKALGRHYPDYLPLYFWMETLFSMPAGQGQHLQRGASQRPFSCRTYSVDLSAWIPDKSPHRMAFSLYSGDYSVILA